MRSVGREALAQAAGFYNGEGYMGLARHTRRRDGRIQYQLHAHVSQCDQRPLKVFRDAVGFGRITKRKPTAYLLKHPTWKPQWRWDVSSFENVQALTALLWTWLSAPKREQAVRALRAWKDR